MARPIPDALDCDLRKLSKTDEVKPIEMLNIKPVAPVAPLEHELPLPPEPVPPKPPELFTPELFTPEFFKPEAVKAEEPHIFEKPSFIPQKPIPHSPKISPSSIPNPNPSVTATKHVEPGYPNYGGYLYSIPGYSAFQPVNHSGMPGYHPGLVQQNQAVQPEPLNQDFVPFSQPNVNVEPIEDPLLEEDSRDTDALLMVTDDEGTQPAPSQTDFEEHFTPEIISTVPTVSSPETTQPQPTESKMNITSLAQGSGATVTIPSLLTSKEVKKKPERFSLKTSIPISKIDMKCVSNPPDTIFQNSLAKKSFNSTFSKDCPRVEIQSNIVIKSATKESDSKEAVKLVAPLPSSSINTLHIAAETINKTETHFRIPDPPKSDQFNEVKTTTTFTKPLYNPMNIESNKVTSDPKNQILFIQNKNNNNQNPKMLLTIQQQNPQVLLQRTSFESKNLLAPSRLLNQNKRCKDDVINDDTSSKVVALKRLHQENCDENDFENLITENQIYGNKIVVKEKSQGTQQEQDLKNKTEKVTTDSKNVVKQPNFLYLSNLSKFSNMMIVKNNSKITQTTDSNKTKVTSNENQVVSDTNIIVPTSEVNINKNNTTTVKLASPTNTKEIHVLKSSNNLLQSFTKKTKSDNKMVTSKPDLVITKPEIVTTKPDNVVLSKPDNIEIGKLENLVTTKSDMMISKPDIVITKPDLVFQTNQKVIMNPQVVFQVPISSIVESDKVNPPTITNITDYPELLTQKKDNTKQFDQTKTNDKLYIACPYQMDISSIVESDKVNPPTITNITDYPELLTQKKDNTKQFDQTKTNDKLYIACPYQMDISSIVESDKVNPPTITNITDYPELLTQKKDNTKQFDQTKTNDKLYIACPYQMDSKLQPKIVITNLRPKIKVDEVSSIDIYAKRKRLRRLKHLSKREKNGNKVDGASPPVITQTVKKVDNNDNNILTPEEMRSEIYKEFALYTGKLDQGQSDNETDYVDDGELYMNIIEEYGTKHSENEKTKTEFLSNFRLASDEIYKEKDLDLQDKMLKHDKVRSAYAAIGKLDVLINGPQGDTKDNQQPDALQTSENTITDENLTAIRKKKQFLSRLDLTQVPPSYKEGYEIAWEVITKERQRRDGITSSNASKTTSWPSVCLETKGQLQIMTEIKQSVSENNNLIKKMLDTVREKLSTNSESISVLAEKNFSELNRLSKMADRSVQLVSGQTKRDLNPGFDSENIQNQSLKQSTNQINPPSHEIDDPSQDSIQSFKTPFQDCARLKIPDISTIISLKTVQECQSASTTQATSMDEPQCSAAGVPDMIQLLETTPVIITTYAEAACQADDNTWPGMDNIIKSYKEYEAGRRREIADLHRRNTSLKVDGAHITRSASRESDRTRALLAERQNLALEETKLRISLQRLKAAINEIKNWTGNHDF